MQYMWLITIHGVMCVNMRSMCMPWWVCMCGACFLRNMDSNLVWFMAHWPRVEPKQSTFFFKTHISFLIEEDVEHAKCLSMKDEAIETWQTWASELFFKETFSFETKSNSFEIKIIFLKKLFSFTTKSSLKNKFLFSFFKSNLFFFQKFILRKQIFTKYGELFI